MKVKEPCEHVTKILRGMKSKEMHRYALGEWYRIMFPYIPYKTGALSQTIDIQNDGIHFDVPYSKYVYFGDGWNFNKTVHPLAQAHWGRVALDLHGKQLADDIINYALKR